MAQRVADQLRATQGIDTHQVRATFDHGVLEVHVPMPTETQRKVERVKIK